MGVSKAQDLQVDWVSEWSLELCSNKGGAFLALSPILLLQRKMDTLPKNDILDEDIRQEAWFLEGHVKQALLGLPYAYPQETQLVFDILSLWPRQVAVKSSP